MMNSKKSIFEVSYQILYKATLILRKTLAKKGKNSRQTPSTFAYKQNGLSLNNI